MREISQAYFLSISEWVNSIKYTQAPHQTLEPRNLYSIDLAKKSSDHITLIQEKIAQQHFIVLEFSQNRDNEFANVESFFRQIFGLPLTYRNPGKRAYARVQSEAAGKYYINSHVAQPLHTDEGYTTKHPQYVALYCHRDATQGGDSVLVSFTELYQCLLKEFGTQTRLLFSKDALHVENAYGIEKKPLLFNNSGNIGISYSPVLKKLQCRHDVFDMFDYISRYLHTPKHQIRFKLKSNQALLFHNSQIIHGRTAFLPSPTRLLYRFWFEEYCLC